MNTTHKRIAGFFVGAGIIAFGSWLMGFDFDHRGFEATATFMISLMFGVFGASFPYSEKKS